MVNDMKWQFDPTKQEEKKLRIWSTKKSLIYRAIQYYYIGT